MTRQPEAPNQEELGAAQYQRVTGVLSTVRYGLEALFRVAPSAAGSAGLFLWLRPERHKIPAKEQEYRASAKLDWLPGSPRVRIYQWDAVGAQRGVMLLAHGWGGRGSQMGGFVEPLRQRGYRVVALDWPGHGESEGRTTHVLKCQTAVQRLQERHGDFAAAICHSFGAQCVTYAMTQGLKAARVVTLGAPAYGRWTLDDFTRAFGFSESLRREIDRRLYANYGDDVLIRLSAAHSAKKLTQPALIIHDQDDKFISVANGKVLQQAWSGPASLIVTQGLGHHKILRDDQVRAQVISFADA